MIGSIVKCLGSPMIAGRAGLPIVTVLPRDLLLVLASTHRDRPPEIPQEAVRILTPRGEVGWLWKFQLDLREEK